jgi:hypothetical protein
VAQPVGHEVFFFARGTGMLHLVNQGLVSCDGSQARSLLGLVLRGHRRFGFWSWEICGIVAFVRNEFEVLVPSFRILVHFILESPTHGFSLRLNQIN